MHATGASPPSKEELDAIRNQIKASAFHVGGVGLRGRNVLEHLRRGSRVAAQQSGAAMWLRPRTWHALVSASGPGRNSVRFVMRGLPVFFGSQRVDGPRTHSETQQEKCFGARKVFWAFGTHRPLKSANKNCSDPRELTQRFENSQCSLRRVLYSDPATPYLQILFANKHKHRQMFFCGFETLGNLRITFHMNQGLIYYSIKILNTLLSRTGIDQERLVIAYQFNG